MVYKKSRLRESRILRNFKKLVIGEEVARFSVEGKEAKVIDRLLFHKVKLGRKTIMKFHMLPSGKSVNLDIYNYNERYKKHIPKVVTEMAKQMRFDKLTVSIPGTDLHDHMVKNGFELKGHLDLTINELSGTLVQPTHIKYLNYSKDLKAIKRALKSGAR